MCISDMIHSQYIEPRSQWNFSLGIDKLVFLITWKLFHKSVNVQTDSMDKWGDRKFSLEDKLFPVNVDIFSILPGFRESPD